MKIRRTVLLGLALLVGAATPALAQFGRNKVQYRAFDFQVIRTDHFDVHFYPEKREAAVDAARMAERSYARLSRLLRHEFRQRKPIILYASHAHFQQTNALAGLVDEGTGGATEVLKNRVIMPFTGSYPDFDHVLTHELVHAFQFDVILRSGAISERGPGMLRLPLWFMEGMAEYLALGGIDPHTASWVRDAVLNGYIRGIPEMNRRDDYLSYRFGQSLWAYIGATWGDEVVGILLQKAPRLGLERAFASTLGLTLGELSDDWLASVRAEHLPALARHGGPSDVAERITPRRTLGDPWYLAPALSPDGRWLVYASQREGFFMDLWLADARTGEVEARLIRGSRSPDFESLRYQSSAGSFSPDGRYIAFAAQTGGEDALYLYDVRRRRVWRKLEPGLDGIRTPAWSPDGRELVFTGLQGGHSDLFITDLDGRLRRLTRDAHADLHPSWSPDGRTIAFSSDRGPAADMDRLRYGNFRVALLDLATGAIRPLPHQDEGKNINPVWSPDSRELAWVSDRSGVNNLYLFDLERRELRQVTDLLSGIIGTGHLTPVLAWARDGGRMVFVHFESGGYSLYGLEDPRTLPVLRRDGPPAIAAADPARPAVVAGSTRSEDPAAADQDPSAGPAVDDTASVPLRHGFQRSLYRGGAGMRPSDRLPGGAAGAPAPISVRDLLDSADLALPDTATFTIGDYRPRLSADLIGQPTVGVQVGGYYGNGIHGGSYVTMSDMLGDHNAVLAGNLNGSLSDATFYGGYGFYRHRANVTLSLQQVPFYRFRGFQSFTLDDDGEAREVMANVFLRDVIRSADAAISYPLNTFRRVELGLRGAHYRRDYIYRGFFTETNEVLQRDERVGAVAYYEPLVAMVFDNALFGWTGPVDGRRYRLQLSRTGGDMQFTEALVDARTYWNHDRWLVLAARLVGLARFGPDSDRFSLFWGGPYFIRGYDGHTFPTSGSECRASRDAVAGGTPSLCPVRDQLIGSSGALLNAEARFPVLTEVRLGFLGQLPPVDGVLFFDAGLAWDERVCTTRSFDPMADCGADRREVHVVWRRQPGQDPYLWREPLMSWGLGLRLNILYAVLRLDYAFPLDRARNGVFSFGLGPSF